MPCRILLVLLVTLAAAPALRADDAATDSVDGSVIERPDWQGRFGEFAALGTIVVKDARQPTTRTYVFDDQRAHRRYSPASTFKIPHTLFALDAGLARDEFQVFPWDGVARSIPAHNRDQDLRSAMRNSTVWVYDGFAAALGTARARSYLEAIDYGNADPDTAQGSYWVDGKLAISAHEQVVFLEKLYRNALPFAVADQRLVKDLMVTEAGRDWILRAKTGWEGRWGWWVGWVEWPTGPVFFALNIDTPNGMDDLYKREAIARSILRSIEALPAD